MSFLMRVLEPPTYGYGTEDALYVPTRKQIFREFASRLNSFRDRRNWIVTFSWFATLVMAIPFVLFFTHFFTWPLLLAGFIYSMVVLGTQGTIWFHRYATHRAYKFKNRFWIFLVKHMVVKLIPDEIYVVSHHVHHAVSELPGDPYNVHGGWWYCFLADANHQPIRRNFTRDEYKTVVSLLEHTDMRANSYEQYLKWGSVCRPLPTIIMFLLNWCFWYGVFYLLGGHALAVTLFGFCGVWGIGVRTFNYDGHGGGKDKRKDGVDFDRSNLSINQLWPGLVTGEWHNNHHLYPNGARAGFLSYQWDYAWWFIRLLYLIGGITSYRDYREDFLEKYYRPWLKRHAAVVASAGQPT